MLSTRGTPHLRAGAVRIHVIKGPESMWLCTLIRLLHCAYKLRFRSWLSHADGTNRSRGRQSPPSVGRRQRAGQGHQGYPPICHTLQASSQQSPQALPLCLCWFALQPAGVVKHYIDCRQGLACTMSPHHWLQLCTSPKRSCSEAKALHDSPDPPEHEFCIIL